MRTRIFIVDICFSLQCQLDFQRIFVNNESFLGRSYKTKLFYKIFRFEKGRTFTAFLLNKCKYSMYHERYNFRRSKIDWLIFLVTYIFYHSCHLKCISLYVWCFRAGREPSQGGQHTSTVGKTSCHTQHCR